MSPHLLYRGPFNDTPFSDNGCNVGCVHHVTGGIEGANVLRRGLHALDMGNLFGLALLYFNVRPTGRGQVKGAGGSGDVKGDAVFPRQDTEAISPDLVGGITIGGEYVEKEGD